jgi:transcriptional regulator with XRE-family HTH domain
MQIFLTDNIKLLRNRRKENQQELADSLGIKRSTLASYEAGTGKPPIDTLLLLADHFQMSVDALLKVNLSKLGELQLRQLEHGDDVYLSGGKLRVLATTVSPENIENVELVPLKVKAGYTAGYNDPEFIRTLPVFHLPFLSTDRKYRAFQIEGDSMLPVKHGSYIIGEFVQDWRGIKDGYPYVFILEEEGAVFKVAYNQVRTRKNMLLKSLNPIYDPYEVPVTDIKEVWKYVYYFTDDVPVALTSSEEIMLRLTRIENQLDVGNK